MTRQIHATQGKAVHSNAEQRKAGQSNAQQRSAMARDIVTEDGGPKLAGPTTRPSSSTNKSIPTCKHCLGEK
eukprot:4314721-Pyramimonas_sp.AAC.1